MAQVCRAFRADSRWDMRRRLRDEIRPFASKPQEFLDRVTDVGGIIFGLAVERILLSRTSAHLSGLTIYVPHTRGQDLGHYLSALGWSVTSTEENGGGLRDNDTPILWPDDPVRAEVDHDQYTPAWNLKWVWTHPDRPTKRRLRGRTIHIYESISEDSRYSLAYQPTTYTMHYADSNRIVSWYPKSFREGVAFPRRESCEWSPDEWNSVWFSDVLVYRSPRVCEYYPEACRRRLRLEGDRFTHRFNISREERTWVWQGFGWYMGRCIYDGSVCNGPSAGGSLTDLALPIVDWPSDGAWSDAGSRSSLSLSNDSDDDIEAGDLGEPELTRYMLDIIDAHEYSSDEQTVRSDAGGD